MPILRLIAKVCNVLVFRAPKSTSHRKLSLVELQELAEWEDFDKIYTVAGVPNMPIPEAFSKKWTEREGFDASKFDDAAYENYQKYIFEI